MITPSKDVYTGIKDSLSKKILPFSINMVEDVPPDCWIYVNLKNNPESPPPFESNNNIDIIFLNQQATEVDKTDFDKLQIGNAGHLFPFLFCPKHIKLARLKSKLDLRYSIPEQILFWILESGAKSCCKKVVNQSVSSTAFLTHLASEIKTTKHFFYSFSSFFKGIDRDRKPDRFSYKSLFWVSDDQKVIYKLYRYLHAQPTGVNCNPAFSEVSPNVVKYYDFGIYTDSDGNERTWIAMENIQDGENCSDWISRKMRKNAAHNVLWIARKVISIWLSFLQKGIVPLDVSLSNAIVVGARNVTFVDLEEVVHFPETFGSKVERKRPILCFLSILFYVMTTIDPNRTKGRLRYDAFRDRCFMPLWYHDDENRRWVIDTGGKNKNEDELLRLFQGIMNSANISEVDEYCKEIMARC